MSALEAELLEEEAEARLETLSLGRMAPERRVVRAGALNRCPVHVHGFPRNSRSVRLLPSIDYVAALLTRLPAGLCFRANVRHVVILPDLVATAQFMLTHLFLPKGGILGYYLYPGAWNETVEIDGPRSPEGRGLNRPGLFHSVVNELVRAGSSRPQKFVVPVMHVNHSDLMAMEDVAERARRM